MPRKSNTITKTFTFEGKRYSASGDTEKEAISNMALKKKALEDGSTVTPSYMTVGQWALICYETYRKGRVKDITYKRYINRLKACVINKSIGQMPIQRVKHIDCQECVNEQAGNSEYQIGQTIQMLNFIFRKAVKNNLILKNPAEDLEPPTGTKVQRRELTSYEEKIFLRTAVTERYKVFRLMYYCGCRPEEARNVEGQDVIVVEGVPLLNIRGTKNDQADRYVPIPDILYEEIKDAEPFKPIATNTIGNKHTVKSFERAWHSLEREMNIAMGCRVYRNQLIPPYPLAEDLVPYCLRHTYCTNLLKQKLDARMTQYVMGHTDPRTTKIYTHIRPNMVAEFFSKKDDSRDDISFDYY